jgi:hypothetical protein
MSHNTTTWTLPHGVMSQQTPNILHLAVTIKLSKTMPTFKAAVSLLHFWTENWVEGGTPIR